MVNFYLVLPTPPTDIDNVVQLLCTTRQPLLHAESCGQWPSMGRHLICNISNSMTLLINWWRHEILKKKTESSKKALSTKEEISLRYLVDKESLNRSRLNISIGKHYCRYDYCECRLHLVGVVVTRNGLLVVRPQQTDISINQINIWIKWIRNLGDCDYYAKRRINTSSNFHIVWHFIDRINSSFNVRSLVGTCSSFFSAAFLLPRKT